MGGIPDKGEFQLNRALKIQRRQTGYLVFEMAEVRRFECGIPANFLDALAAIVRA